MNLKSFWEDVEKSSQLFSDLSIIVPPIAFMIPRGKLSISTSDLFKTLFFSFFPKRKVDHIPFPNQYGTAFFCLSARTGLDLALRALELPPGSAILTTNINIPDMFAIIRAHQLEIQPIAVNEQTLTLSIEELVKSITDSTKAILVTHLFGGVMNMKEIIRFAKENDLVVIEDCAQAFNFDYQGHPQTDIVLFSFGLIKTNTTLTGAITAVRKPALFDRMNALNQSLPVQRTNRYRFKILKAILIQLMTSRFCYTLIYHFSRWAGRDFDELLAGITKGFPGADVNHKIRFRPCPINLKLLAKRTSSSNHSMINQRKLLAQQILSKVPRHCHIGSQTDQHTYWVLPIKVKSPTTFIDAMRNEGIDASAKASSLISLTTSQETDFQLNLDQLVYLPIDKKLLTINWENFFKSSNNSINMH